MSDKKLLREYYELCPNGVCKDYLTESDKRRITEEGIIYLTGVIQRADAKNGNGRIYPRKILEREVDKYKKIINENRALGELDHPESNTISLSNVSHIVESVWWDGNDLMGKIRVLKHHPKGKILEGLIRDGVQTGISSRAIGSIREESDAIIVEDDLNLICFDIVQEPSTHNAFMIREHKEFKDKKQTKIDKLSYHLIDILK